MIKDLLTPEHYRFASKLDARVWVYDHLYHISKTVKKPNWWWPIDNGKTIEQDIRTGYKELRQPRSKAPELPKMPNIGFRVDPSVQMEITEQEAIKVLLEGWLETNDDGRWLADNDL